MFWQIKTQFEHKFYESTAYVDLSKLAQAMSFWVYKESFVQARSDLELLKTKKGYSFLNILILSKLSIKSHSVICAIWFAASHATAHHSASDMARSGIIVLDCVLDVLITGAESNAVFTPLTVMVLLPICMIIVVTPLVAVIVLCYHPNLG